MSAYRRWTLALILAALQFTPSALAVPTPGIKLQSPLALIAKTELTELLRNGDLCWSQPYGDGSIRQFSVAVLVRAPVQRVWGKLCDYEHQAQWVPGLLRSKVLKRRGARVFLQREYEVPGTNPEFRYEIRHEPKTRLRVTLREGDGQLELGSWRIALHPVDGGRSTLLVQDGHILMESSSAWQEAAGTEGKQAQWLQQANEGLGFLRAVRKVSEE